MSITSLQAFTDSISRIRSETTDPFDFLGKSLTLLLDVPPIASYSLYIRDPITGELRLQSMDGIQHPEPLLGFVLSSEEEARLRSLSASQRPFDTTEYFAEPEEAKLIGRNTPTANATNPYIRHLIDQKGLHLYNTFVNRERIAACVRCEYSLPASEIPDVVFFVNFARPVDRRSHPDIIPIVQSEFTDIVNSLDMIQTRLDHEYPKALRQFVKILQPIRDLAAHRDPQEAESFFFENILKAVMAAMEISNGEGFATIHSFDPAAPDGNLTLRACTSAMTGLEPVLKAYEGEGIVSWVALNRKSVLVHDMSQSAFDRIRRKHQEFPDIQSELAVPMMVGQQVVGVLNIERNARHVFTDQDVHTLWYAATEAALAYTLSSNIARALRSEQRVSELLEIAHKTANTSPLDSTVLTELAELLKRWLSPSIAEVWAYEDATDTFSHAGATYPEFTRHKGPRPSGTSTFVVRTQTPVWVWNIADDGTFRTAFWDVQTAQWTSQLSGPIADGCQLPQVVHPSCQETQIASELGVPIRARGRCIGVIWLKYIDPNTPMPQLESMSLITKLAGQIGIVVDSMIQLEMREDKEVRKRIVDTYFDVGNQRVHGLQAFVLYNPCHGKLGGDFCVSLKGNETSWPYLLGDVVGHGWEAAVRMLPLFTAFNIFYRESQSPNYVLQQLTRVNSDALFATAICFVYFEQVSIKSGNEKMRRRFIKASSAGHPSLIVCRSGGTEITELPKQNGPACTHPLGVDQPAQFGEDCIEVFPGDVLVGYTDGLVEARNPSLDQEFGRVTVIATALRHRKKDPEAIAQAIYAEAKEFAENSLQDDVTIIVVKIVDDE